MSEDSIPLEIPAFLRRHAPLTPPTPAYVAEIERLEARIATLEAHVEDDTALTARLSRVEARERARDALLLYMAQRMWEFVSNEGVRAELERLINVVATPTPSSPQPEQAAPRADVLARVRNFLRQVPDTYLPDSGAVKVAAEAFRLLDAAPPADAVSVPREVWEAAAQVCDAEARAWLQAHNTSHAPLAAADACRQCAAAIRVRRDEGTMP